MPRGYPHPVTDEEKETIKQMLLNGTSVIRIARLVGRSAATISSVKKELGLMDAEAMATRKASYDVKVLCQQWHWKDPREQTQKQKQPKVDWWAKDEKSQFRTPYTQKNNKYTY